MADIKNQLSLAQSTPQDAVSNISDAKIYDINPDQYKYYKTELQSEAELVKLNSKVTRGVAQYSSISSEHASLIKKDTTTLSQAENLFTESVEKINGKDLTQKINALKSKRDSNPSTFTPDDEYALYELEDDLASRKNFKVDKPGKHDEFLNSFLQKEKDVSFMDASIGAVGSALSSVLATTGKVPQLLYDSYFYPANLIRSFRGQPEIEAPESIKNNPVVKHYGELAKAFREQAPQLNKDVTRLVADGEFIQAGEVFALKLLNNFPNQAAVIASTMIAGPGAGLTVAGVTSAAESNYENQSEGFTPSQSLPNAMTKGVAEGAFERLGTIAFIKEWEGALTASFGKDKAGKVLFNALKAIGASGLQEGTEEALTTAAQALTDKVSGINNNALDDIGWQMLESGILGVGAGVTMTAPATIAKAKYNVEAYGVIQENKRKAVDILNFDSNVSNALELLKQTEMGKLSPSETAQFMQIVFDQIGLKNVFLDKEALQKWANNPQKSEAVRNIIDPTGEANAALNAPIKVNAHEFFAVALEFPDIQDLYKLSPVSPSVQQATDFLKSIDEASTKRMEIFDKLQIKEPTPEDVKMIQEALNTEQPSAIYPSSDIFGEAEYLDQSKLEKALEPIMPEGERTKYLADQLKAKQQIVDHINESAQYELNEVIDVAVENAMEAEIEAQLQRLENNPNLVIVDRYTKNYLPEEFAGFEELKAPHHKEGYSPFAIDPRTLPKELKGFTKNPQLKKHKAFVKGGIHINLAASLLGVRDAETLLNILSQTPSREDIAAQRAEARRVDIEREIRDNTPLNELGIQKAYDARLTNALKTMEIMKDKFWSSTKKGFKRIALTPPTPRSLKLRAKETIRNTRVGDLNVNQFRVGERKSERLAVEAIQNNQAERAFINQEAVAKNIVLAKETQLAIGQVNRVIKLARKFNKPSVIQELKDAGYLDAANDILESFNLTSKRSDATEKDSFNKWVKKMMEEGQGDFTIPERLLDQRQPIQELTVEQALAVGKALQNILHQARFKNKLYRKFENIKGLQTVERITNLADQEARKNFDFDPEKAKTFQQSAISDIQREGEKLVKLKAYLERTQHIIAKLDQGKDVGFFNDLFWRPLVDASNNEKNMINDFNNHFDKIIETFGKKDFENLANEMVFIPEFKEYYQLNYGKLSKKDLLGLELNFGNEGNIQEIEKFGGVDDKGNLKLNRDLIRKVLDRELQDRHTVLAQNIWNIYKSYEPKMKDLQKRTEGVDDVDWVESKPFVARGKEYPGGYYPISRRSDKLKTSAKKAQGAGEMSRLDRFKKTYYGKAMTETGHLEARTGNDDFIDLDLKIIGSSVAQIIHDLTHREVIADGVKLLSDKKMRETIASVVGKDGYSNIIDTYIAIAEADLTSDSYGENAWLDGINRITNGLQIVALAGKINSVLIQPASIGVALNRMGVASTHNFMKTVNMISSNPNLIPQFYEFAEQINPAIRAFTEDISKNVASSINDRLPTKTNKLTPWSGASEFLTDGAFTVLSEMDRLNKVLVTITAYQVAMEGKAPGLSHLKGNHAESAKYASNISEATQTHNDIRNLSPIQRNKYMRMFTLFFNDLNNLFNNVIGDTRKARALFKEKERFKGILTIATTVMTLTLLKIYTNLIRGEEIPGDDKEEGFIASWSKFMLSSSVEGIAGTIPLVRDIEFGIQKFLKNPKANKVEINLPLTSAMSDIGTSLVIGGNTLGYYLGFIEETRDLKPAQIKALWSTAGIILKAPTVAAYDTFLREKTDREIIQKGTFQRLSEQINRILTIPNHNLPDDFVKDLVRIDAQVNPQEAKVSKETYDTLKEVISNSDPYAYNEKTGAAGVYQFTEKKWNDLMENQPQLGLTENGRVSSNTEQQQRAFEFLTKESANILKANNLEDSPENLFATYILGNDKAIKVLMADDDKKINTLVDSKTLEEYKIDKSFTVKAFKDWLLFTTFEADERLTKKTNN